MFSRLSYCCLNVVITFWHVGLTSQFSLSIRMQKSKRDRDMCDGGLSLFFLPSPLLLANVVSVCLCVRHGHSRIAARAATNSAFNEPGGGAQGTMGGPNRPGQHAQDLQGAPQASNTFIYKIKIKLATLRLCVCLSWFKETRGLHSVRRTRVPTST
jgi:hypothetical protein